MNPIDVFREAFEKAAGRGCLLELHMRLLAGATPAIAQYQTADNLSTLEDRIAEEFKAELLPGEADTLRTSRQLRNKLIHCDLSAARDHLGAQSRSTGAVRIDLATGDLTPVAGSGKTAGMGVFGWMLEFGYDYETVFNVFTDTIEVVKRLSMIRAAP